MTNLITKESSLAMSALILILDISWRLTRSELNVRKDDAQRLAILIL